MKEWSAYNKVSGVYAIENLANGKAYVGQSQNIGKRWREHVRLMRCGESHCLKLQAAWKKHGEASFKFSILELAEIGRLSAVEQAWIDRLDSVNTGYNFSPTAGSRRGTRHSEITKQKMKKRWEDTRVERSAKNREVSNRPEIIELRKKVAQRVHKTAEFSAKMSVLSKAGRRAQSALSQEDFDAIRKRYVPRCSVNGGKALAAEFGISKSMISLIVLGKCRT